MPTLTKANAKYHCRTCLRKLINEAVSRLEPGGDEIMHEFKDIYISLSATATELQDLISKYIYINNPTQCGVEYPQNLCIACYEELQNFDKFRKRAQECAEKLNAVLINDNAITKLEVDYDVATAEQETKVINNVDIYKLLLKDTLMETESVLLESTTVATLANTAVLDPDPFDTTTDTMKANAETTESLVNSDIDETSASKRKLRNIVSKKVGSNDNGHSDSNESYVNCNSGDDDDDTSDEDNKPHIASRVRKRNKYNALIKTKNGKKKRRRTKKEMEELRKLQAGNMEHKNKRRNKGTKNNFKCSQCNHSFAHKITLDAHVRKVHEGSKRPFQCDRCDKAYTFIGGLYTHIKEIHEAEVRSYTCDHSGCDRVYTSYIAMQKHKRVKHTDTIQQKKYVCEQCGATFNQTCNLKYHRRTKHPTDAEQAETAKSKELYECVICKKLFHSRYTLKYHTLQLHTNDMKYECTICGRRMAKKFMLVQHMLVHSTDKMPCEHCGKQFIRKFELEAHIRAVHMKLKPFECQYCSECFASRKTLRHHEYIHTGEKPYVCELCGQAYRQQTCLKNHRKSHEKLSTESLLAANLNLTLMNTVLSAPQQASAPPGSTLNLK